MTGLPITSPAIDLGAWHRDAAAWWAAADDADRARLRDLYATRGWTLCPHAACPPWDCKER